MENQPKNILRLSELQAGIQAVISKHSAGPFWVVGEIMEISENASGHCYIDLVEKEEGGDKLLARVRCTIWAYSYRMLKPYFETTTGHPLKQGIKVLVQSVVEYHPVFGLSLNIKDIDPSYTLGDIERRRREIIARLEKEGVIGMNRELPLPLVPQKLAVISSETAAGFGDFINQLSQNPNGYVFYTRLFPAAMQGDLAGSSIISALDTIHECGIDFDLVALIRGGGSKADLSCFDSYELAYYITQFPVPVLTGIGHEQDETITDLVAHTRLKTPTAVAEFIIERAAVFESLLETRQKQIIQSAGTHLGNQRLRLQLLYQKITAASESRLIRMKDHLIRRGQDTRQTVTVYLDRNRSHLDELVRITSCVDPSRVMKLGYSITRFKGRAVRDASELAQGDGIETTFSKGKADSTITKTLKK